MNIDIFSGSSSERVYSFSDENGQPLDLASAGIVRVEVCAAGRTISSDTDSVVFSGNTITVKYGDLNFGNYSQAKPFIKLFDDNDEFEAIPVTSDGVPVTLSFVSC